MPVTSLGTLDPGSESYSLECRLRRTRDRAWGLARQEIRHDTTVSGRHGALRAPPGARRGPKFTLAWGAPLPYSEAGPLAVAPGLSETRMPGQIRTRIQVQVGLRPLTGRTIHWQDSSSAMQSCQ